jgi:glyoxylase-like metal-dependent hydrolase (beta-lactamase superfamily II)
VAVELKVKKIEDNIYWFNEITERQNVDAYLVIGTAKALMIDCLMEATGVYAKTRELTSLPVDLLVTHGHGDHCGKSVQEFKDAGCTIYMDLADLPLLVQRGREFPKGFFAAIDPAGGCFDLGGVTLEVIHFPGHTPGSVVVLDRKRHILFSSDGAGAGIIWLWLPASLSLHEFRDNIKALYDELKQYPDLRIYPGHRHQEPDKPLGLKYLDDVYETAKRVISGELTGQLVNHNLHDRQVEFYKTGYKSMYGFCYNPANL